MSAYTEEGLSYIGERNQKKGKAGEDVAEYLLRLAGVEMVEKIATPIVIWKRRKDPSGGGDWVKIRYVSPVSGDRRGILPGGRRVLAEVKVRDRNLRWSDLEDHQIRALDANHSIGAVSLLIWIHPEDNIIMRWPIPKNVFRKGRGLKLEIARNLRWDPAVDIRRYKDEA